MIIHEVFQSLASICKFSDSETIYHCLNAAKQVAIEKQNYELAAAIQDLRVSLTNGFEPVTESDTQIPEIHS